MCAAAGDEIVCCNRKNCVALRKASKQSCVESGEERKTVYFQRNELKQSHGIQEKRQRERRNILFSFKGEILCTSNRMYLEGTFSCWQITANRSRSGEGKILN